MSCFSLPKKLKHLPSSSKKVWNSFTSSLSPKLYHLRRRTRNLPKTLTKTATRLLDLRHKRCRFMTHPPPRGRFGRFSYYKQYQYYNYQHFQPSSSVPNSPETVYVDRLFEESTSKSANVEVTMKASTSRGGSHGGDDGGGGGSGGGGEKKRNKIGDKWKEYVSSMPTIKGVDERAEEFISKFRQQISLQREQSIIDFQEMLARSA